MTEDSFIKRPHPLGDECASCGSKGWQEARKTMLDGKQVTVADGYGLYHGLSLVADGWLDDHVGRTPAGSFRSEEIARRVITTEELTSREP